jgi:hypothetical protein
MPNVITTRSLRMIVAASCLLLTAANAQEAYDIMSGRVQTTSAQSRMLSFGENPAADFPPKARVIIRTKPNVDASVSYCVRTCDGRYFPAPSAGDAQSKTQGCKNLCPAGDTKVFSGSSIDNATSKDGRAYTALPNAFLYRKELVAGCTCNGKDPAGLASIKPEDDKTLQRGDLIARETGLEVVKRVDDGNVSFAKASAATQSKFERLPVVAAR